MGSSVARNSGPHPGQIGRGVHVGQGTGVTGGGLPHVRAGQEGIDAGQEVQHRPVPLGHQPLGQIEVAGRISGAQALGPPVQEGDHRAR
jgi:hypothetical protein